MLKKVAETPDPTWKIDILEILALLGASQENLFRHVSRDRITQDCSPNCIYELGLDTTISFKDSHTGCIFLHLAALS